MAILKTILGGIALASLFFYPLLATLSGNKLNLLQWTKTDSIETAVCWATLSATLTIILYLSNRYLSGRVSTLLSLLLLEFGLFMTSGALVRYEPLASYIKDYSIISSATLILFAITNIALILWICIKRTNKLQTVINKIILIISPIGLIFIFQLTMLFFNPRFNHNISQIEQASPTSNYKVNTNKKTIIILFDELSPNYLYGFKKNNLELFPSLKNVVNDANKFMNVYLPGGETSLAVENLLNKKVSGLSLKDYLENKSISSRVMGWSLNYCVDLLPKSQNCTSTSLFNSRTLTNNFSILNPIWTNFNLLPYQKPYGFIRIPASTEMHRRTLAKKNEWLSNQINDTQVELIFAHFNVPHPPIIDDENMSFADSNRYNITEESYLRQFRYVDETIKLVLTETNKLGLGQQVNLIIISDHNVRALTPKSEHEHITFLLHSKNHSKIDSMTLDKNFEAPDLLISILKRIF